MDNPYQFAIMDREGMTLRDWFAGQALMGALSANPRVGKGQDVITRAFASAAYELADAMLAVRNGRTSK